MTSSHPSAFDLLAPQVQRWIWQQKWKQLRNVQEQAIPAILTSGDVIVSARTAAGKTEAAMLPLITRILAKDTYDGFALMYVSPLKALINDQFRRLEELCEACGIQVHKWHGDVSSSAKSKARSRPNGIVLITPESLEAILVRRGGDVRRLFSSLDAVVIDELHAFIGSERGMQLQSILNRIEVACDRESIDRIGLSATLGNMSLAAESLRPSGGHQVRIIEGNDEGNGVRLQIRGYYPDDQEEKKLIPPDQHSAVPQRLADDLYRFLRGEKHLLFAGSRQKVELYADLLRHMCDENHVPNEFFPHHGSLSKPEREDLETRLKDDPRPTTAVATTTLELGIDIGSVETVAQIGPGFSISSLKQRVGRSGRRHDKPATLRIFVIERKPERGQHPLDRLNLELVQSIATVELMREGVCEPPNQSGLHLSTLLHQVLALALQYGGISARSAWHILCEKGPFKTVDKALFSQLLRCMGSPDNRLIEQSSDGLLMVGEEGEKITESYEFYPVFATEREYRILHDSRVLGSYPLTSILKPGETLIFSGRRWSVITVDDGARVIQVKPSKGAQLPQFDGKGGDIHDIIVARMREVLQSAGVYPYLDTIAQEMLQSARSAYIELGLTDKAIISFGEGVLLFPWVGTKNLTTLSLALLSQDYKTAVLSHAIEVGDGSIEGVESLLDRLAVGDTPSNGAMMKGVSHPNIAKFDQYLDWQLMTAVTLRERVNLDQLPQIAGKLLIPTIAPSG
ncbi:DEAD/DEAH box helicase [Brucella pituitosa]